MAGMLPGVECARRRRFHQGGGWSDSGSTAAHSSRRSSFCLYASNHETHHTTISSLQRIIINEEHENQKLGGAAREAKQRLDERLLRRHRKSETKRVKSKEELRYVDGRCVVGGELQTEVYGSKKGGSRRFSWSKLTWKALEQDECAICLERFRAGETLVHLPCAHRFHSRCLVPWLETSAQCPCCRSEILTTTH